MEKITQEIIDQQHETCKTVANSYANLVLARMMMEFNDTDQSSLDMIKSNIDQTCVVLEQNVKILLTMKKQFDEQNGE